MRSKRRGTKWLLAAATGMVLLISAAPAAATVTVSAVNGNRVDLNSDAQGDTIVLNCTGGIVQSTNGQNATPINTALPCANMTGFEINGNDGGDTIQIANVSSSAFPALIGGNITTGAGNDVVNASQVADNITADPADSVTSNGGDDSIVSGLGVDTGEGDDTIDSATGVNAGPGDDTILRSGGALAAGAGDDHVGSAGTSTDGGPGDDTVELGGGGTIPSNFTVKFTFTDSSFTLEQSLPGFPPASQTVPLIGFEHLEGQMNNGGIETFDSTAFSGTIELDGLDGPDTILTGTGDDVIAGGDGNDVLEGGGGFDYVTGGAGNDELRLRDDGVDRGDCGSDADSVVADAVDLLKSCESVDAPLVETPSTPTPPAVDTQDPETIKVKSPKKVERGKKAVFEFASSEGGATFQCRVDAGPLVACGSPYSVKTKKLGTGKHFFEATATDAVGNTDTSPIRLKFKVTPKE